MSCVAANRLSCTAYEFLVFIAVKNLFLVDHLMFVVCIVFVATVLLQYARQ